MGERYRRGPVIARGGMGEVYAGVAHGEGGFSRPVVIKRLLPHLAEDEKVAAMFLSEARLATRLLQQNIVQMLDVGRGPDGLFLVMEMVDGWDVAELLRACETAHRKVPPHLAAFVVQQVLAGLTYAYRQRVEGRPLIVAHRDISASNVLLSRDGEVKLADFGIARVTESKEASEPGIFKGKYAYAAPEVLRGAAASHATDQFSLGILLYQLLSGRHPFGPTEPLGPFLERLQLTEAALLLGIDEGLGQIVRRMLARDPQQRFESPEACARELAGFLARVGEPASQAELAAVLQALPLPPSLLERVAATGPLTEPAGAPPEPSSGLSNVSFEMNSEWDSSGPALSADGRLERAAPDRANEPSASTELPGLDGAVDEPTHIRSRITNVPAAPAALSPAPAAAAVRTRGAPPPSAFAPSAAEEGPLELAERGPRVAEMPVESFRDLPPEKPPRRGGGLLTKLLVLLLLLGGGAGALWWYLPELKKLFPQSTRWSRAVDDVIHPPTPLLMIDSEPSGAKVVIDGQPVGETPYLVDNLYPKDVQVPLELRRSGYQTWSGTFRGGERVELRPKLRRR